MTDDKMTEQESLQLISQMIHKAKNSYHHTGTGPILWGSIIALCSLITYFEITFNFNLPFDIWWLTFIAIIPQIVISVKQKRAKQFVGHEEKMLDYIWIIYAISIFILVLITNIIIIKQAPIMQEYSKITGQRPLYNFLYFANSFYLLLYGVPTLITGGSLNFRPMVWGGILCWVCCIVSIFTSTGTDMLLSAISACSAWLIPGIILRNKFKRATAANV